MLGKSCSLNPESFHLQSLKGKGLDEEALTPRLSPGYDKDAFLRQKEPDHNSDIGPTERTSRVKHRPIEFGEAVVSGIEYWGRNSKQILPTFEENLYGPKQGRIVGRQEWEK